MVNREVAVNTWLLQNFCFLHSYENQAFIKPNYINKLEYRKNLSLSISAAEVTLNTSVLNILKYSITMYILIM